MNSFWLKQLSNIPSDWALLPLDGNKIPTDPQSGLPLSGWSSHPGYCINDIQELSPKAVGVLLGPVSGGLIAIDFDGAGSEEKFQGIYGRPSSDLPKTLAWSSGKPERRQEAFIVDLDWWEMFHGGKSWRDEQENTVLELRWRGQQSAFAGAHPETSGYYWLDGCSPNEFPEATMAPDWLLMPLIDGEPKIVLTAGKESKENNIDAPRAEAMLACLPPDQFSGYWQWLKVGMALHSVDSGLLNAWINWSRKMDNFNEKECKSKWKSFGKSQQQITIASLYLWAKQNGYQEPGLRPLLTKPHKHQIKRAGGVCADVGKIIWTLPGFAATGLVLLAAETGSGKTTIIYRAAEAIQEGGLFLNEVQARKGNVLVVQGDEPEVVARRKISRMGLKANFDILYASSSIDLDFLIETVRAATYTTIIIDSLTTVLVTTKCTTLDQAMVDKLYILNKVASDQGVLLLMTAHLNKPGKDGNGKRKERTQITWSDISGLATIGAAVNDCWGLAKVGDQFSLHCLGKRHVEAGTEWLLERDAEDYWWGLKEVTDGLKPLELVDAKQRIIETLHQGKSNLTAQEVSQKLGLNVEHARRCLCDLHEEGKLQRQTVHLPGRGRPTYCYGLI